LDTVIQSGQQIQSASYGLAPCCGLGESTITHSGLRTLGSSVRAQLGFPAKAKDKYSDTAFFFMAADFPSSLPLRKGYGVLYAVM
jgi:hypothetical protein